MSFMTILCQLGYVIPNIHVTLDHSLVTLDSSCHFGQCHKRPCFLLVTMAKPNASGLVSQFLRLLEIHIFLSSRVRSEPLFDYRHLQILTSSDHVENRVQISKKKVTIEERRIEK